MRMAGGGRFAREWNRLVEYVLGLAITHDASIESTRTAGGTHLSIARRGTIAGGPGRVVVLSASATDGPADFEALTYAVTLLDSDESIPELTADKTQEIYRVAPIVRAGETFANEQGFQEGWKVDPARPGTYGRAVTYPRYDESGEPVAGETVTEITLFDERPHVRGCTS